MKEQSSPDSYRMLVVIDGATTMRKEDRSQIFPHELTLMHNLKKLMSNDWEGFVTFDPFVPIEVRNYSEKEFESCYQYYVERKWIQHEKAPTEEGKQELLFLCNYNPGIRDGVRSFL